MFLSLSKVQKFIHFTEEVVLLSYFARQTAILMFDFYGELKPKTFVEKSLKSPSFLKFGVVNFIYNKKV